MHSSSASPLETPLYIEEKGDGYPLVFFHGWGFDHRIWTALQPLLCARYRLYLVDLPGFGLSASMTWEVFKSQLIARLPSKFAVVGWSLGGLYATRLAVELPSLVSHLLNVATSPRFVQEDDWFGILPQALTAFYQQFTQDALKTVQSFLTLQRHILFDASLLPLNAPSPEGLKAGLEVLSEWDLRDAIKALTMPVCYHFGRLDSIVPIKVLSLMQTKYPLFKYHLYPRAGHLPFLSHPEQFIALLSEFV